MTNSVKRSKMVVFVGFLWIIQSVGRLCFATVGWAKMGLLEYSVG